MAYVYLANTLHDLKNHGKEENGLLSVQASYTAKASEQALLSFCLTSPAARLLWKVRHDFNKALVFLNCKRTVDGGLA